MRAEIVSAGQDYESPAGDVSLMVRIANPDNLRKAYIGLISLSGA